MREVMSLAMAAGHWLGSHVPLVWRYRECAVTRSTAVCRSRAVVTFAGRGEVWFDSMEVAVAAQARQQWRAVVDDAATFMDLDRLAIVLAEEYTAS